MKSGQGGIIMAAIHVTTETFEQEVLQAKQPVLVDFWADWCVPCKMLMPTIEALAEEVTNAKICKVNVDTCPQLAMKYHILHIPTLIIFKEGKPIQTVEGGQPKEKILEMLNASV